VVSRLPNRCRPRDGKVSFNLNHHEDVIRVDIGKRGKMTLVNPQRKHQWISLDGIVFPVGGKVSQPLTLSNGWTPTGAGARAPGVAQQGSFCVLTGTASAPESGTPVLGSLPPECRPQAGSLSFTVNHDAGSETIQVLPTGDVQWVKADAESTPGTTGFSLDGIHFVADAAYAQRQAALRTAQGRS